jgi:DNA-binding CsgD family transcriptional regulator
VEWRRVCDFASAARTEPAVLAVQGEAGSGKSTLWRAGVQAAVSAGYRLLRSEPAANEADLSFAGLSDLLAGLLAEVAGQIPAPQLEALEVALLVRPAGPEPPTAYAVGLAVLAALRAGAAGPLAVAIDDVQWLDHASLDALTFAVRRITEPISLLLAARTAADDLLTAGAAPLSQHWRGLLAAIPAAEEIELAPLDLWQVQNLLPRDLTAAQVRLVARQSRGNPFWANEISASLDVSATAGLATASVPPLARMLTERLARCLSPVAAEALATVAAAGRITVAEALVALGHLDDPAAALDSAILARVLIESGGRIAAAHPLIGAAAVDALPPGRKAQLYGRLAAGSDGPERYAQFAALAAGVGPDAAVADALDAAAEAAHARAANAAAAQFAAQAVVFGPPTPGEALVRRRIRAAELLSLAGDHESALAQLSELDGGHLETADLERALPLLADLECLVHGSVAASDVITKATGVATDDLRRRALVFALASDPVYGDRRRWRALAEEAIRCAEAAGESAASALHRALINLAIIKVKAGEGLDSTLLDRATSLEARVSVLQRLHDTADLNRGNWSRYTDDLDGARAALNRVIGRAQEAGDDWGLYVSLVYLAGTEQFAADYQAAAAALEAADSVAGWHDWPPQVWYSEVRCELLIAGADFTGALARVNQEIDSDEGAPPEARFIAEFIKGKVAAWQEDQVAAARHFEMAASCADDCGWMEPALRYRVDTLLAQALVSLGRTSDARRTSAWLRAAGERLGRPSLLGDAHRIEALAAAQAGDLEAAAEAAEAAVAAHGASPLRLELAKSLLVLGRIERRRKARGQSRTALNRAREVAAEIGHRPLVVEIDAELRRVAPARSEHELTDAEQRVADLIAAGSTNRQTATALFVSVRTVETHVASIYRKLGVRTRAELARMLSGISASSPP